MTHRHPYGPQWRALLALALSVVPSIALAQAITPQSIPGSADVSRVKPDENLLAPMPGVEAPLVFPEIAADLPIPEGAKSIKFVLHDVVIKGNTTFPEEDISDIYVQYLDEEVTLEVAYKIASEITRRYRNEGYFLTLTTVPDQKIQDGVLTLQVTEGYIGAVDFPDGDASYYVVQNYIDDLKAQKPLKAADLESFVLRLNDMPGWSYRAVLSPLTDSTDGAIKLTLVPAEKAGTGFVSIDNFNSRYLGPHEGTLSYSTSLIPFQQTTVSMINSAPWDRLHYGALTQRLPIYQNLDLEFGGSKTKVQPGFSLKELEIKSSSDLVDIGLDYQLIRQRQQNLSFGLKMDARDTTSDTLGIRIMDDKIRAVRANIDFDTADSWEGYSTARFIFSQGIDGLGSSQSGDDDLSRSEAKPNFEKWEISLSRLQRVTDDWSVQTRATAQFSNGPLYSAEQYGYGGQLFGRAFDSSELIGDQGASGSVEIRYGGLTDLEPVALQPFAFYDVGLVTNKDPSLPGRESASSIGAGVRFNTPWNQSGSIAAAVPMIRQEATPIYGMSEYGPRISFQFTQSF